ncbi:hypothetical protein TNCV_3528621 [Trichonephila clavipes]|nr:hypothetical protein TNCV_3528621 [Trichonephila clavipes]
MYIIVESSGQEIVLPQEDRIPGGHVALLRGQNRRIRHTPVAQCTESAEEIRTAELVPQTATAGSDVVQSGRPIFDDFFQHLWPYIGNNTANVVFQMVKRLWLIRIDQ